MSELEGLSIETRAKLIQEAEESARQSNLRRQKIIAAEVEARINGLIDVEIENLGKRQGFAPNQRQIMQICDNVRTSVRGQR